MYRKNNGNGLLLFLLIGPYAFFTLLFSLALPPVGFLMALHKFKEKRLMGEGGFSYFFLMILSVLVLIAYILFLFTE